MRVEGIARVVLVLALGVASACAIANAWVPQDGVPLAAARDRNVDLFREMLKQGASIRTRDGSGHTALEMALLSDSDRMINEVLQHKPELDVRGGTGYTPLGLAGVRGNEKAFRQLLRAGAAHH